MELEMLKRVEKLRVYAPSKMGYRVGRWVEKLYETAPVWFMVVAAVGWWGWVLFVRKD